MPALVGQSEAAGSGPQSHPAVDGSVKCSVGMSLKGLGLGLGKAVHEKHKIRVDACGHSPNYMSIFLWMSIRWSLSYMMSKAPFQWANLQKTGSLKTSKMVRAWDQMTGPKYENQDDGRACHYHREDRILLLCQAGANQVPISSNINEMNNESQRVVIIWQGSRNVKDIKGCWEGVTYGVTMGND